ncbi:MAG: D-alanine--D-alanine ligase [Bacilli bacterium]|nr:D-alanine--D-alanine ligase [Bacilli bacterium]
MKIKLGVIFGGNSVEHEISIITAVQAMGYIDENKYDIIPIYIDKNRIWYTGKMLMDMEVFKDTNIINKYAKKVILGKTKDGFVLQKTDGLFRRTIETLDIAFPIVHGKGVEDGSLAGYLDTIGIPYVGPDILGAAVGQDKVVMKQLMESSNIPVPKYTWFYDTEYLYNKNEILEKIKQLSYPVIIKPAKLGSSIGINVAKNEEDLDKYILEAIQYDNKIVVEKVIEDLMEVNCSVLGNYEYQETSLIDEMLTKNDFLTFEDKYIGGNKGKMKTSSTKIENARIDRVIPARINEDIKIKIEDLAKKTFVCLNLSGLARIDFLINKKTNEIYVNEPNTIPGSLAFYLWEPKGKKYETLLDEMITSAIKNYKNNSKKISSFETNVLSSFNGSKGLKGNKGKLRN